MSTTFNGWVRSTGEPNLKSAPSLACVPVEPVAGSSTLPQVWEPETVIREQTTRDDITRDQARRANLTLGLTASGELQEPLSTDEDPHFQNYYNLIKPYGRYPKDQAELDAWGVAAGLDARERMRMAALYDARAKKPGDTGDQQSMTMQPTVTMAKDPRDKKATTYHPAPPMEAQALRDVEAKLAQVRAISAGTSPAAAVRTPVRAQRSGFAIVAAAKLFAAFMRSQSDTAARREIAAARQEVAALAERIRADRETKRMTGRA